MSNKYVLVTGGSGYIGSQICKALIEDGYTPVILDLLSPHHKWGIYAGGDINQYSSINNIMQQYKPLAVMHCAALTSIEESFQDPIGYYYTNVVGTMNVITAMKENGIKHIIFSSSCAIYGVPEVLPVTENTPKKPIGIYDNSKYMVEIMLEGFKRTNEITSVALRYFNVIGADSDYENGKNLVNNTRITPLLMEYIFGLKENFYVFGNNYPTRDKTALRDYIHVEDIAQAHILSLQYLLEGKPSEEFNVCADAGYTVLEVIQAAEKIHGSKIEYTIKPERLGASSALYGSSDKIKKALNWSPKIDNLEDMIRTEYNWFKKIIKK